MFPKFEVGVVKRNGILATFDRDSDRRGGVTFDHIDASAGDTPHSVRFFPVDKAVLRKLRA